MVAHLIPLIFSDSQGNEDEQVIRRKKCLSLLHLLRIKGVTFVAVRSAIFANTPLE